MIDLNNTKNIYFIGIGGSGMSSIANMMLVKGKNVFGSDKESTLVTKELEEKRAHIFYTQISENITPDIDLVIYTVAIPESNPELQKAKALGIPLATYPQMLGILSKDMITIGVSGTHGKTTTTAMMSHILEDTEIAPTVIVGSVLSEQKTNFIEGKGEHLLVEADEYKKSFLNLNPTYLIITNIDEDHLDFYKDLADIQNTFGELITRIPEHGYLVCNKTNEHIVPILEKAKCTIIDYANNTALDITLSVPGIHNRQNAGAAYTLAKALGIPDEKIIEKLKTFKGVRRRFEYKGKTHTGALIYDDYAHNPQKVAAALQGAKEAFPDKKIIAVFQPHLFSRTKFLLKTFGTSFSNADQVLLAAIYAAREEFDPSISSEMLAEEIKKNDIPVETFKSIDDIKEKLDQILKEGDVVVMLGAGDIIKLSEKLIV